MKAKRQVLATWAVVAIGAGLMLIQALVPQPGAAKPPKPPTRAELLARVEALEAMLACVTVSGTDFVFEGCNVHVRNGDVGTQTTNGLGNLIIGYNEYGGKRGGSHNLVIGQGHSYTSYGGLVAGSGNAVTGANASVAGGSLNLASAANASVSGGRSNRAISPGASVSGGTQNTAGVDVTDGGDASVSGGFQNTATGFASSVSGGSDNTASGEWTSISGGDGNTATADWASVSGGGGNTASGPRASVSGGNSRSAAGDFDWVAGMLFQDD